MRIGTDDEIKWRGNNNLIYYILAIIMGIVFAYLLIFVGWSLIKIWGLIVKYWYGLVIAFILFVLARRFIFKRKEVRYNGD